MVKKCAVLLSLIFVAGWANAQDTFPSRPITIVVPYPAGGTSDSQARIIQEPLARLLGQPIVIDNKPGASGAIAAAVVARSKADGYTLLYPNNGILIAPLLNKEAQYNPLKDFKPVSTVSTVPMVLIVNKNVPVTTIAEFVKYAKEQPNGILYASAGTGSYGHLTSTRFAQIAGFKVDHVPYKGEANTTMAVRSGEVQMLLTTPSPAMLGQVNQGNMKLLGVASPKYSPVIPGASPLNSAIPGFTAEVWFGLLAPIGTPDNVIKKLNVAVQSVVAERNVRVKLLVSGAIPQSSSSAEFSSLMKKEAAQWDEVVTKYKIKAD